MFKGVQEPDLILWKWDKPKIKGSYNKEDNTLLIGQWSGRRRFDMVCTLLHELVHVYEATHGLWDQTHGAKFAKLYRQAALEVFGISIPKLPGYQAQIYLEDSLIAMASQGFLETLLKVKQGDMEIPHPEWYLYKST